MPLFLAQAKRTVTTCKALKKEQTDMDAWNLLLKQGKETNNKRS